MIFFVANDGTIIKGLPSPVYQGSANTNTIYLIAPFASGLTAAVAFQLPNGVAIPIAEMTKQDVIPGVINKETGEPYSGWTYNIPSDITEYYGTVTAQFYFYAESGGVITATSATSFQVAKGVPAVLPNEPSADVYELILENISSLQKQLNNSAFAARAVYAWNSEYTYGANEMTFYPIGEFGVFIKSIKPKNTAKPYIEGILNSEYWELIVDFDKISETFFGQIHEQADRAENAAEEAAASADEAVNAAEVLKNVSARTIKFVPELPETGDSKYIYAVVSEADINLFDLWAWVDGVLTYFGSANMVTDIDNVYIRTLPQDGWENNSQFVEIAEANTDKKVIVMPLDMSAAAYIKYDVVPTLVQGGVTFSCGRVPNEDIGVVIQVTVKNEVKNFAGYYTKPQVDSYLSKKQDISDDSLQTSDKTVVGAINENAVAIDGLRRDIIDEAHFRGYFKTNADVHSAPGNANDYAWSAESGTVWIYGAGGWENSGAPIPDKTVPPSTTTPLMDGVAAVGSSTNYARADHVHPSDTKKANASDLNAEISNRETADVQLSEKIENVYRSANVVLRVEGWSNHQQIINLPQVSATNGVIVYPDDASSAAYVLADIYFTQINGQIVFACVNTPTENISITVETFN